MPLAGPPPRRAGDAPRSRAAGPFDAIRLRAPLTSLNVHLRQLTGQNVMTKATRALAPGARTPAQCPRCVLLGAGGAAPAPRVTGCGGQLK